MGSKNVVTLATEIAEHAITLVRDEDKLLPIANLKPDARILNVVMTNGDDRTTAANSCLANESCRAEGRDHRF